ncbi:MAG TPA: glucose-6-phosphate isomerase family protein [Trebonia sp.]|nr:glucose-6-phosphate isomerase family protein [Trebonia sp.]
MALPQSRPFQVMLDFGTGSLTPASASFVRRLSDMADAYEDQAAVDAILSGGDDPVIYTGFDAAVPHETGHLLFRTTIISAGTVGSEFYMTKGHHHGRDSAELYLGMSGEGTMVMETRGGDFAAERLVPSATVYVPPGWAHRTVNTGDAPLIFLAVYFGDAGHDYESVQRSGFARRVHGGHDGPELRADGHGAPAADPVSGASGEAAG